LADLHAALTRQHYSPFEIIYIVGPTEDGAWEAAQEWAKGPGVKIARCDARNLSLARNMGVALAAGDLVAFIDDDALPEPEWLVQLVGAFNSPEVAGAGGVVFDPTGVDFQFRFCVSDRLGATQQDLDAPFDDGAYPLSPLFPSVLGANCMFRRAVLAEVGGFDEEYEYYLDETDLCCRLVDAGYAVRQVANAPVHHKFLRNHLRNAARILVAKYPVLKNQVYFCLVNDRGHATMSEILAHNGDFFARHRTNLQHDIEAGRAPEGALAQFDVDADKAWRVGLARGLSGARRLRAPADFASPPRFAQFQTAQGASPRRTIVLIAGAGTDEERKASALASRLANSGHDAHVIVGGAERDEASLRGGAWIRRRAPRFAPMSADARAIGMPEPFWRIVANVEAELRRMAEFRTLDIIEDVSGQGLAIAAIWRGRRDIIVRLAGRSLSLPTLFRQDDRVSALCRACLGPIEAALIQGAKRLSFDTAQARRAVRERVSQAAPMCFR